MTIEHDTDTDQKLPDMPASPEAALGQWVEEVRGDIRRGEASGFVHAGVNFDIIPDDSGGYDIRSGVYGQKEGDQLVMLRNAVPKPGIDISRLEGMIATVGHEVPIIRDDSALYVSTISPNDVAQTKVGHMFEGGKEKLIEVMEQDKAILAFTYTTKQQDRSRRTGVKSVYLIVPEDRAAKMQSLIDQGISPQRVHDAVADVFTDARTRPFFDEAVLSFDNGIPTPDITPQVDVEKIVWVHKADLPEVVGTSQQAKATEVAEEETLGADKIPDRRVVAVNPQFTSPRVWKSDTNPDIVQGTTEPKQATKKANEAGKGAAGGPPESPPPHNPTPETPNTPEDFRKLSFDQLLLIRDNPGESPDRRRDAVRYMRVMADEFLLTGAVNREALAVDIQNTLTTSDRTNVRKNLRTLASDIQGTMQYDPRYKVNEARYGSLPYFLVWGVGEVGEYSITRPLISADDQANFRSFANAHLFLGINRDQIVEAFRREPRPIAQTQSADSYEKRRLAEEEQYQEFLIAERWTSIELHQYKGDSSEVPLFYVEMDRGAKELLGYRIELQRAAYFKRNSAKDLEIYSDVEKNPLAGFKGSEIQALYDRLPGFREHLETWVDLMKNPENYKANAQYPDGRERQITIFDASDRASESEPIRQLVEARVVEKLIRQGEAELKKQGRDQAYIDTHMVEIRATAQAQSIDSGQAAFNWLYAGNFFEASDSQWTPIPRTGREGKKHPGTDYHRTRGPQMKNDDFVVDSYGYSMRPLDTLVFQGKKGVEWGRMGVWAATNLKKVGNFNYIQTVPSENEYKNKFWQIKDDTLYIPEAVPVQTIGSVIDRARVEIEDASGKHKVPIREFLERQETVPWTHKDLSSFNKLYVTHSGWAAKLEAFSQGKNNDKAGFTEMVAISLSILGFNGEDAFSGDSLRRRQWLVLQTSGFPTSKKNAPTIDARSTAKKGMKYRYNTFTKGKPFLPWDGEGLGIIP